MPIQYNTQDIPINGKLDMHSDSMDVQPPNMIRLENVAISAPGRFDRRPGIRAFDGQTYRNAGIQGYYSEDTSYGTGTTVWDTAPAMFSLGATPVSLHKHRVMTHNDANASSVQTFHGNHFPYPLERGPATTTISGVLDPIEYAFHGTVRTGNYLCRAYSARVGADGPIYLDVWEANTGEHLVRGYIVDTMEAVGRACIAPSNAGLAIAYSSTTANNVKIAFFTTSSFATGTPTIATTVTVTGVDDLTGTAERSAHMWDFVGSYSPTTGSDYFAFAYKQSASAFITVRTYSQTGVLGTVGGYAANTYVNGTLRITQNVFGYYVIYTNNALGTNLLGLNTALTQIFNVTILAAFTAVYTPAIERNYALTLEPSENGVASRLRVWISALDAGGYSAMQSSSFNLTTGAEISASARHTAYNYAIASRGFVVDNKACVAALLHDDATFGPLSCGVLVMYDYSTRATTVPKTNPYAPFVFGKYGFDQYFYRRNDLAHYDVYVRNQSSAVNLDNTDGTGGDLYFGSSGDELLGGNSSAINYTQYHIALSQRAPLAFQGTEVGNYLFLSGACPSLFDGVSVFEANYNEHPRILSASATAQVTTLTTGTYLITYCWEWQDAQSRVHRSQPATPQSVTITINLGQRISLTIPRLEFTQKEINNHNVFARIYVANPSDPFTYYSHTAVANVAAAHTQSVQITAPANTAAATLYTTGGALENDQWPSVGAMCSYQNRLFVVDTDNDRVLYSKSYTDQEPPELSTFNELRINDLGGDIVNIRAKDQLLMAQKRSATYITSGQPANDLGQGANFSEWQPVSQSVGCKWPRATTQTSDGIWFVSDNGPQLFSQGQIANIGLPVSPFAGYDFLAAGNIETANRSHVVFSVYSGTVAQIIAGTGTARLLVYDRTHQTWLVWSNQVSTYVSGICSPSGTDKLYYGIYNYNLYPSVAAESNTVYQDLRYDSATQTYYSYVRTGWINFGSQQSLVRVRRMIALLESMLTSGTHTANVYLYRDFDDTLTETSAYTSPELAGYPIQFRVRTAKQKMQSLSLELRYGFDSASTTMGARLDGLAIEIGQRGGAARLPGSKTQNV